MPMTIEWSNEELEALREMWGQPLYSKEIAKRLNKVFGNKRTVSSVQTKGVKAFGVRSAEIHSSLCTRRLREYEKRHGKELRAFRRDFCLNNPKAFGGRRNLNGNGLSYEERVALCKKNLHNKTVQRKALRNLRERWRMERLRYSWCVPQRTGWKIGRTDRRLVYLRSYMRGRGYDIEKSGMTAYYDEDTRRYAPYEEQAKGFGMKIVCDYEEEETITNDKAV